MAEVWVAAAASGADQLPNTGVKLSMLVFGGLTLLILGGGAFLAGRGRRR